MAGIGFRLQKILQRNTYRSLVEAYLYSALVSTGPWLLSVLGLAIIGFLSPFFVGMDDARLFRAVIIYAYLGSLALTGPVQMGTTRYIADRLYVDDSQALLPCYHWVGSLVLLFAAVIAGLFSFISNLSLAGIAAAILLFQSVSITWIGMVFLSAAKDYMSIVYSFAIGYTIAVALTAAGGYSHGFEGMLWGFAIGMAILAWLLSIRIQREFPSHRASDSSVLEHWREMPHLLWIGFFYNFGIFVDKLIFWIGPHGEHIQGLFYSSPRYDTTIFLAYLSIVPAMALFVIRIETGFYKHYAAFYETITRGGSLTAIGERKENMLDALRISVVRLVTLQGTFSAALYLLAPELAGAVGIPPDYVPLMRICLLAAFAQVMLMLLLIILLYFDWRRESAWVTAIFCISNAALTTVTQLTPDKYHGFGYLTSCVLTIVIGLVILERRLRTLEYETFSKQPIHA